MWWMGRMAEKCAFSQSGGRGPCPALYVVDGTDGRKVCFFTIGRERAVPGTLCGGWDGWPKSVLFHNREGEGRARHSMWWMGRMAEKCAFSQSGGRGPCPAFYGADGAD